ncbi:MAG TPA: ComEA family DNA-binding protein [Acidimicrobiales bacterium]|nr:ComEA family DNA-binding protein [Acidimicrobiales bacterium]
MDPSIDGAEPGHRPDSVGPGQWGTAFPASGWPPTLEDVGIWLREGRRAVTVVAGALLVMMAVGAVLLFRAADATGAPSGRAESLLPRAAAGPSPVLTEATVVVHLAGGVRRPGVYRMEAGSRVIDVVEAGGGFAPDARPDDLNLAELVRDGDQIRVPVEGEPSPAGGTTDDPVGPVDVNRADATELQRLKGVGPALAAAIIAYRESHGDFATLEDLLDVPGIGPAKLEALRAEATT